jgi:hypothetical protein
MGTDAFRSPALFRTQALVQGATHAALSIPVAEQKVPAGQSPFKLQAAPSWLDAQAKLP